MVFGCDGVIVMSNACPKCKCTVESDDECPHCGNTDLKAVSVE